MQNYDESVSIFMTNEYSSEIIAQLHSNENEIKMVIIIDSKYKNQFEGNVQDLKECKQNTDGMYEFLNTGDALIFKPNSSMLVQNSQIIAVLLYTT